jgi:hypothetical protein
MSDVTPKSKWAAVATRQESAPKSVVAAEDNPTEPKVRRTEKNNLARPIKKAATFRLPPDVFELVDAEIAAEAALGNRLTKDDAITRAVRAAYGKKGRRK